MCASSAIRYFLGTSWYRPPSLIYHLPWHGTVWDKCSHDAWPQKHKYSRWYLVAVMFTSWDTLFHIYFQFQAAIFNCPPTLTSFCANIRPTVLFDAKYMRIPLKFHISNVRFKCFRFHIRHFDCWLNSFRIVHRAVLLSAGVTSAFLKKKFNGHQVYHMFTKKSSTSGDVIRQWDYFENLNVNVGIHRSAMENTDRQLRYLRKTKGVCNFAPPAVRGLKLYSSPWSPTHSKPAHPHRALIAKFAKQYIHK